MDLSKALEFARSHRQGVLTTIRRDGRPQISNIIYAVDGAGVIRSRSPPHAKTKNLQRDPRASLYVCGDNFWAYAVLDGHGRIAPLWPPIRTTRPWTSSWTCTNRWPASTPTGTNTGRRWLPMRVSSCGSRRRA